MLPTAHYRPVIDAMAAFVALPSWDVNGTRYTGPEWLEAQVLTESSGNPDAVRYEPHLDPDGHDDGLYEEAKSYGLMQVLGTNIRRLCGVEPGTRMDFSFALLPLVNIALGVRMLTAELAATQGDVARALARYNAGTRGDQLDSQGRMRGQAYVDRVAANAARVRADREAR
jgi:soluble lytic murein transglycosylase-like protein